LLHVQGWRLLCSWLRWMLPAFCGGLVVLAGLSWISAKHQAGPGLANPPAHTPLPTHVSGVLGAESRSNSMTPRADSPTLELNDTVTQLEGKIAQLEREKKELAVALQSAAQSAAGGDGGDGWRQDHEEEGARHEAMHLMDARNPGVTSEQLESRPGNVALIAEFERTGTNSQKYILFGDFVYQI
jgi:hypothetical protein